MNLIKSNTSKYLIFILILLLCQAPGSFSIAQFNSLNGEDIYRFSPNKLLSTNDWTYPHHVEVTMAISNRGFIYVGWKNSDTHNGGGKRVSIVRSIDGGHSWTHPYDMPKFNKSNTEQSDPWLFHHNDSIYYAYLEFEKGYLENPGGDYFSQITVAKTTDLSYEWNPIKASEAQNFADKETLFIGEDGTIYVAYVDAGTEGILKLSRSIDGGDNYEEISIINQNTYYTGPYVICNSSNALFIAWSWLDPNGGDIMISKSIDGGFTFDPPNQLNDDGDFSYGEFINGAVGKTTLPVLQLDPFGRIYVIWADKYDTTFNTYDVYIRYSDDYGASWSSRLRINPTIDGNQWHPSMVIDSSGRLHIAYYHENYGVYRPYYRTLNFTGINRDIPNFTTPLVIADRPTNDKFTRPGEYLAIQLDSEQRPHVAWSDGRNNAMDIYYAYGLTHNDIIFSLEYFIFFIILGGVSVVSLTIVLIKKRN